jgi:hypothetical protein
LRQSLLSNREIRDGPDAAANKKIRWFFPPADQKLFIQRRKEEVKEGAVEFIPKDAVVVNCNGVANGNH